MRIVNLMENTKGKEDCLFEHGLSFYIEAADCRLLVDTGATAGFITNAGRLSVDLGQVDYLVLSHGHYDHAGGILSFADRYPTVPIIMQKHAMYEYYHKTETEERYIGIDSHIKELKSIRIIDGDYQITDGIFIFTKVMGRRLWPKGNQALKVKRENQFYQDEFSHEQYLVVEENGKRILVSGCAHNGILNILDKFREIYEADPDVVVSGFHMQKKSGYTGEDLEIIKKTGMELKNYKTEFYTGHCTGEVPYEILKGVMGEKLHYVHSGDEIHIN